MRYYFFKISGYSIKTLFTISILIIIFSQRLQAKGLDTSEYFELSVRQQDESGIIVAFSFERGLQKIIDSGNIPEFKAAGKMFAVPAGAEPVLKIISLEYLTLQNVDLSSNPRNLLFSVTSDDLVELSEKFEIRGIDAIVLEINPFQYNSSTKELLIYRELLFEVKFIGGSGRFGDDRLWNRYWDQIYESILINYESLSEYKTNLIPYTSSEGYEYLIIVPDNPAFLSWADSLRRFRTLQGIKTGIVTLSEIGGNDVNMIEAYIDNAYNTWVIPPAAILMLGDHGEGPAAGSGIAAPVYNNYCASDNIYADVDGDHLPDLIVSRITARNGAELESIIGKILSYERNPPENQNFYNKPLCAGGWQSTGTSILCCEIVAGFYDQVLDKLPTRQYSGYGGGAPADWPADPYSTSLINTFGPNGLGYIPATPSYLTDWNGSAAGINNAINNGSFAVYYRGQGSVTGWSEPAYSISDLTGLNKNYPPFIFSVTSLSGKFNGSEDSFAEAFLKHPSGALGLIAATELTYSAPSSDYGWGLYDYLWQQFFNGNSASPIYRDVLPAFANAAAKYFLFSNNSTFHNPQTKEVTYNLYHHFGDAFSFVYTEIPESLTVYHDSILISGEQIFSISADENSSIGLTVGGEIIASGTGTAMLQDISIPPQIDGDTLIVTVTKQNYLRYAEAVMIQSPTSVQDGSSPQINTFFLCQNYPNPFNPTTTIKYAIPVLRKANAYPQNSEYAALSVVRLKVYDILGNEVAVLVNSEQEPGIYEIEFNASDLSNGIYFYRIELSNFSETKKMLLLK